MGFMPTGAFGMNIPIITKDNFVPNDEDIFVITGKDKQRLIFGEPLEFEAEEIKHGEEFKHYLEDNDLSVPETYDFREQFRFYQGCNYDPKMTYEGILENHQFISENIPVEVEGVEEFLQNGMVYFYKRDIHFRPVCIINVKKLVNADIEEDQILKITIAMADFVTKNGLRPGAIENWTVILDLKSVGITEIPKKKLQALVSTLQSNFRGRLYKLYAINMPFMLRAIWSLVKGMWDKFTQKKMNVYGGGFEKDLLEVIPNYNLEKRFGGDLDDLEEGFYPPQLE